MLGEQVCSGWLQTTGRSARSRRTWTPQEGPSPQLGSVQPVCAARSGTRSRATRRPGGPRAREAYATGITDLRAALANGRASRSGKRKGRRAGFPTFKSRRRDHGHIRFTTGAIRAEADRRTISCRSSAAALEGEHQAAGAPGRRGEGPDLERNAVREVGAAVRLDRLTANRRGRRTAASVRGRRSNPTVTSMGSSDSHATALAVIPAGPSVPTAVTTVTPVANVAITDRKPA